MPGARRRLVGGEKNGGGGYGGGGGGGSVNPDDSGGGESDGEGDEPLPLLVGAWRVATSRARRAETRTHQNVSLCFTLYVFLSFRQLEI